MKRLLIITDLSHACPRVPDFSVYLPDFGWHATIITPLLNERFQKKFNPPEKFFKSVKTIEVPFKGDVFWFWRKIFGLFGFNKEISILNQIKEKTGDTSKKSLIDIFFNLYRAVFAYPDEIKNGKKRR
jgi:hypothetical protein